MDTRAVTEVKRLENMVKELDQKFMELLKKDREERQADRDEMKKEIKDLKILMSNWMKNMPVKLPDGDDDKENAPHQGMPVETEEEEYENRRYFRNSRAEMMSLKIFFDKKKTRVLFAEAEEDFVNFLCHLLSLPLGAVTRVLCNSGSGFDGDHSKDMDHSKAEPGFASGFQEDEMIGAVGRLYDSLQKLGNDYIEAEMKERLLRINAQSSGLNNFSLLHASMFSPMKIRRCASKECVCKTVGDLTSCSCGSPNTEEVSLVGTPAVLLEVAGGSLGGYVREAKAKFMVTDDLVIKRYTPDLSFSFFGPCDWLSCLENKVVDFGPCEELRIMHRVDVIKICTGCEVRGP